MKEQLVSYKTAILAREKGLPISLDTSSNVIGYNLTWNDKKPTFYKVWNSYPDLNEFLYAPTQSGLHKWLIEEKNFFIVIHVHKEGYSFNIHSLKLKSKFEDKLLFSSILEHINGKPYYQTYIEAFETALLQTLGYIK